MSNKKRNFSIESLERRECLTATIMEVEPNDNQFQGTRFSLDPADNAAELIGTSLNDDDKDWFRFTVPTDGFLSAEVSSPNGNFAALEVERLNGSEVMSTDPNDGVNTTSGAVSAGEELFVRMRSKDGSAAEYSTLLTLGDTDPGGGGPGGGGNPGGPIGDPTAFYAEVENNDRKFRATPFDLIQDGVIQLQGTSTSDDDKDFFSFTMPADGDVTFEVFSTNNEFAQLQIEDRFGNDIIETDPNDGVNTGSVTLQGGDTFYLRMRAKDAAPAQYEVNIGLTAPTGPAIGEGERPNSSAFDTNGGGNAGGNSGPVGSGVFVPNTPMTSICGGRLSARVVAESPYRNSVKEDHHDTTDAVMSELNSLFGSF